MGHRAGITTTGTGRVAVVPDVALVRLAAQASDASSSVAHRAAAESSAALVAALRSAGIADRDLRTVTTRSWTDPGADGEVGTQRARRSPRTTVTMSVEARVRDLPAAGQVIGAALEAAGDAARLEGTTLQVSDQTSARVRARELAFGEAVAAARQLADLAGRRLGAVLEVREVGAGGPAPERMAMRAAAAVPVEAGEQEVVVELVVRHGWAAQA